MTRRLLLGALPVAALLLAALVFLLQRGGGGEHLLGGPLVDLDLGQVRRVTVREGGRVHRLERHEGVAWSLEGALADWVDPRSLAERLAALGRARGGAVLAGTQPEDRRYEFNGPAAVRLTLAADGGREVHLAFGATNPVTGLVYASGGGRPGCFPVERQVRDLVAALPRDVRVATLLPPVDVDDVQAVTRRRGDAADRMERHDGRWWLEVSGLDDRRLTPLARAYQARHDDRRRRDDSGRLWVQAAREQVRLLVDDVSAPPVRRLAAAGELDAARAAWHLDEPWRDVVLEGPGLDPDPTAADPDRLEIVFGPPLDVDSIGALRRGLPLLAGKTPVESLERPGADFVDVRALTWQVLDADTVTLRGPDGVLLRAARDPDHVGRFDGRSAWHAVPPLPRTAAEGNSADDTARFLVLDLDRLRPLAVLPATPDTAVLRPGERYEASVVWNAPPRRETYRLGVLDPERLPGGTAVLAPAEDNPGPVGLWRPRDGALMQVPSGVFLTGRNLRR